MTWSILLGLGAALGWGTASFWGGLQSRRLPALLVTLWSQLAGALLLLLVLLLVRMPPTLGGLAWGFVAGLFGSTALLLFYSGMALGAASLIAPISACGVIVPVLVGLARGEVPGLLATSGILLAILGIVLVTLPNGDAQLAAIPNQRLALLLALGAALGFGMFFVVADIGSAVPATSPLWVAGGSRVGGLTLLCCVQLLRARSIPWPGRAIGPLVLIGGVDTTATALYIIATQLGSIGVVAVLSSLYPVVTVALSQFLLAERLSRVQYGGVTLALAGVAMLAAG